MDSASLFFLCLFFFLSFFIIRLVWRNRKSPLKLLKFHRFSQQLATNVSINQDCIKSAKAEPLKYLIIEHNTVVILNPEPCWEDALSVVLSAIALWNFPWFRVSQFVTSLEPPALTFYNLVLFSIYVNDGTTISRSSVIINIKQILLRKGSRSKHVVEN